MRRGDLAVAAVLTLLGLYVVFETSDYPPSMVADSPGAAFFPRLVAGLLVTLSGWLAFQALRPNPATDEDGDETAGRIDPAVWPVLPRSTATLGLVALFLLAARRTDFLLLLAPLLAGVMALMGERRPLALTLAPVGFVLFVWLVFSRLFGVPFPGVL